MHLVWLKSSVIAGVLTIVGVALCVVTVIGFAGAWWWVLDLFSHFRAQYLIGLILVAAGAWFVGGFRLAGLCAVFAALNLMLIAPFYLAKTAVIQPDAATVRILSINVNTWNDGFEKIVTHVQQVDPDVVVLLEVDKDWHRALKMLEKSHPHGASVPREGGFGMALRSRRPLARTEVLSIGDSGIPSISARVLVDGTELTVLGVHLYDPITGPRAQEQRHQLQAIGEYVAGVHGPLVLAGDMNMSPWSSNFSRLLQKTGLHDSARGWGVYPTWPSDFLPLWIPIDHCLLSPDLRVVNRTVGPNIGSDHYPLLVEIALPTTDPLGKGLYPQNHIADINAFTMNHPDRETASMM